MEDWQDLASTYRSESAHLAEESAGSQTRGERAGLDSTNGTLNESRLGLAHDSSGISHLTADDVLAAAPSSTTAADAEVSFGGILARWKSVHSDFQRAISDCDGASVRIPHTHSDFGRPSASCVAPCDVVPSLDSSHGLGSITDEDPDAVLRRIKKELGLETSAPTAFLSDAPVGAIGERSPAGVVGEADQFDADVLGASVSGFLDEQLSKLRLMHDLPWRWDASSPKTVEDLPEPVPLPSFDLTLRVGEGLSFMEQASLGRWGASPPKTAKASDAKQGQSQPSVDSADEHLGRCASIPESIEVLTEPAQARRQEAKDAGEENSVQGELLARMRMLEAEVTALRAERASARSDNADLRDSGSYPPSPKLPEEDEPCPRTGAQDTLQSSLAFSMLSCSMNSVCGTQADQFSGGRSARHAPSSFADASVARPAAEVSSELRNAHLMNSSVPSAASSRQGCLPDSSMTRTQACCSQVVVPGQSTPRSFSETAAAEFPGTPPKLAPPTPLAAQHVQHGQPCGRDDITFPPNSGACTMAAVPEMPGGPADESAGLPTQRASLMKPQSAAKTTPALVPSAHDEWRAPGTSAEASASTGQVVACSDFLQHSVAMPSGAGPMLPSSGGAGPLPAPNALAPERRGGSVSMRAYRPATPPSHPPRPELVADNRANRPVISPPLPTEAEPNRGDGLLPAHWRSAPPRPPPPSHAHHAPDPLSSPWPARPWAPADAPPGAGPWPQAFATSAGACAGAWHQRRAVVAPPPEMLPPSAQLPNHPPRAPTSAGRATASGQGIEDSAMLQRAYEVYRQQQLDLERPF